MKKRPSFWIMLIAAGVLLGLGAWYGVQAWLTRQFEIKEAEVHSLIVREVEKLGRLELIKYQLQDVVRYSKSYPWWPDPALTLMAYGEAIACIDLAQIGEKQVDQTVEKVVVTLPQPFLCVVKIDHSKSSVLTSEWTFMEGATLADSAFKKAEVHIRKTAENSDILPQARAQAITLLTPLLTQIAGRPVEIRFEGDNTLPATPAL